MPLIRPEWMCTPAPQPTLPRIRPPRRRCQGPAECLAKPEGRRSRGEVGAGDAPAAVLRRRCLSKRRRRRRRRRYYYEGPPRNDASHDRCLRASHVVLGMHRGPSRGGTGEGRTSTSYLPRGIDVKTWQMLGKCSGMLLLLFCYHFVCHPLASITSKHRCLIVRINSFILLGVLDS